jgi:hypothetical protein
MIPSEDARKSTREVKRYFRMAGQAVEIPDETNSEEDEESAEEEEDHLQRNHLSDDLHVNPGQHVYG